MNSVQLKLAAISALRQPPEFSRLHLLQSCSERGIRCLLRWLDESGLALYLLARLEESGQTEPLPRSFISALHNRAFSNQKRADAMLVEVGRLSTVLTERAVHHAFLKGVTLVPEFCPVVALRHQSDIDILVSTESIDSAKRALRECGYSVEESLHTGEIHFSKPRTKPPSIHDDIYTSNFQPEVELHTSIWTVFDHVTLEIPHDFLTRVCTHHLNCGRFSRLSTADIFVAQILHGFRHLLGSWIRVAWLFEIHNFLIGYWDDRSLWLEITNRLSDDPRLRNVFGLMLSLTNELFPSPISEVLGEWCIAPLPAALRQWVAQFGTRWALANLSGSKLSLLAHKEFIEDPASRRSYLWRRMIPVQGRPGIGRVEHTDIKTSIASKLATSMFFAKRALFHAGSLASFGVDALRWSRVLAPARRRRAISP